MGRLAMDKIPKIYVKNLKAPTLTIVRTTEIIQPTAPATEKIIPQNIGLIN
jgi:hypothetical protein